MFYWFLTFAMFDRFNFAMFDHDLILSAISLHRVKYVQNLKEN